MKAKKQLAVEINARVVTSFVRVCVCVCVHVLLLDECVRDSLAIFATASHRRFAADLLEGLKIQVVMMSKSTKA